MVTPPLFLENHSETLQSDKVYSTELGNGLHVILYGQMSPRVWLNRCDFSSYQTEIP